MEIDREHSLLVCPYCGNEMILEQTAESAADQPRSPVLEQKKGITFGTLSMILGILSFLSCGLLCLPELAAIALVILSFVREKDKGSVSRAIVGLVTAVLGTFIFVIYLLPDSV